MIMSMFACVGYLTVLTGREERLNHLIVSVAVLTRHESRLNGGSRLHLPPKLQKSACGFIVPFHRYKTHKRSERLVDLGVVRIARQESAEFFREGHAVLFEENLELNFQVLLAATDGEIDSLLNFDDVGTGCDLFFDNALDGIKGGQVVDTSLHVCELGLDTGGYRLPLDIISSVQNAMCFDDT